MRLFFSAILIPISAIGSAISSFDGVNLDIAINNNSINAMANNNPKAVYCPSTTPIQSFTALLDDSNYNKEGFFDVTEAALYDGVISADKLTCVGNSFSTGITCLGYINRTTETIIEATLQQDSNKVVILTYRSLRGKNYGNQNKPWICQMVNK